MPDWFITVLLGFAHSRSASQPHDKVFRTKATRTKPSRPITSRRLDSLFGRIQKHLSWADQQQVTAHTLRHHAIAVVGMASRVQVAEAFARHAPSSDTHLRYGIATAEEVAAVVISLYGGNHPWVNNAQ